MSEFPKSASHPSVTNDANDFGDVPPPPRLSPYAEMGPIDAHDLAMALDQHAIVAVTDAAGKILHVNDKFCAISQYSRAELLGSDHRIVNSGEHPPAFFRDLWRTISRGQVWSGEICNRAKDGSLYWVATTIVPCLGPDRKPTRHIAIRNDISERVRAQLQQAELLSSLQKINRELEAFAYVVSHDLKAPLRAISSLANWLEADYADQLDQEGHERFALLQGRVRRMDALIEGILRYSRVGRDHEEQVEIDVAALVNEVCEMVAPPPSIAVRVVTPLPTLRAERTRLMQVFENLVSNAVKHLGRPTGEVTIACERQGDGWVFCVRDNGQGIDSKYFAKIFEPFQTLRRRDEVEGTGIGLALVKKNVELMGGRVWVESTFGAGSAFFFQMPAGPRPSRSNNYP